MLRKLISNRRKFKADENALIVAVGVIIGIVLLFIFGLFIIVNIVNIGIAALMIGIGLLAMGAGVTMLKKGLKQAKENK